MEDGARHRLRSSERRGEPHDDGHSRIHSRERSAHGRLAPNEKRNGKRIEAMRRGRGRERNKRREEEGLVRSGYKNDLRLTGACRSCGEPGKTWWQRGRKAREVDGWVLHPLSTGLLGHSYASAVRPISSRNGLSYVTPVTSTSNFRLPNNARFTILPRVYFLRSNMSLPFFFLQILYTYILSI